jgi:TonB family protein
MVVSIVIHVALLVLVVAAYRERPPQDQLMDQFVTFLVPPNKPIAQQGATNARWSEPSEGKPSSDDGASGKGGSPVLSTGPVVADSGDSQKTDEISIDLPSLLGDSIHLEIDVDSAVQRYEWSAAPSYPIDLLRQEIQGHAFVIYVVDTTGTADSSSLQVVRATHPGFVQAVREALPKMRFRPAILGGLKVRQLVQQNFAFKIQKPDSVLPPRGEPPQ